MRTATHPETGERLRFDEDARSWVPMTAEDEQPRGSLLDVVLQGPTFGFSDELGGIGAALGTALATGDLGRAGMAREREVERQRGLMSDIRERQPIAAAAVEIPGAMITGGPLGKGLMTGLQRLGAGRVAAPIGAGVIEGTVAGTGTADENKWLGALLGGGMGGLATSIAPTIAAGFAGLKPLGRRLFESPRSTAVRTISERSQAVGDTPQTLRERSLQLGPEATMSDVMGPAGIGLGQGTLMLDDTGKVISRATKEMEARAAGSTQRIGTDLQGITGVKGDLKPAVDAITARQKAAADPAYALARSHDMAMTPELKNILQRPTMQKVWKRAQDDAADRGDELPPVMRLDDYGQWVKDGVMPDVNSWDLMKRAIDDMIDDQVDKVSGKMSRRGATLVKLKNDLLAEVDKINPDYGTARQIFAGPAQVKSAVEKGQKFLNANTEDVVYGVKEMTDSEKDGFLMGAMAAVREKMGRASSGQISEFNFLEKNNALRKLRALFPDGEAGDAQMRELRNVLERERLFAENQGLFIGGSQTAMREAAKQAVKSGVSIPTGMEILTNPVTGMTGAALGGMSRALGRMRQGAVEELGERLFDPQQVGPTLAAMSRYADRPELLDVLNAYARGGARLAPGLGMQAGQLPNE